MQQPPPMMHTQQWGGPRGMAQGPGLGMTHPMNIPRPYHMGGAPRPMTVLTGGAGVMAGQITSRPPMLNMPRGMPMTMTMPVPVPAVPGVPPVSLYIGQVNQPTNTHNTLLFSTPVSP